MADSVIKRQVELEQNLIKKAQSNCPNTSLDLSIISPNDKYPHDDSGYTGLDSTPRRPYRRIHQKRIGFQPEQNDTFDFPQQSLVQIIHYIVIILVATSLCFGVLVGTMNKERSNMKYVIIITITH